MSTVTFAIHPFNAGYYITINYSNPFSIYNNSRVIIEYLKVNIDCFNNTLKLYKGAYMTIGTTRMHNILYFKSKENAMLFISEFLEPLLITKELS